MPDVSVSARIQAAADRLTTAERKVATSITDDPQAVAFGTVAEIARLSGSSGASVVRLATKLGFSGFSELQAAVQAELGRRLRPATERIHDPRPGDLVGQSIQAAVHCVQETLSRIETRELNAIVALLSKRSRPVSVLAGDAGFGVARQFVTELDMLRPGVRELGGSLVDVARRLADVGRADIVVALDLRRYDRLVVEATALAADAGATIIALTDGPLSPLAQLAQHVITIEADGVGPFDDYVGALAALELLTAGVALKLRGPAAARLELVEHAWRATGVLVDPDGG